MYIFLPLSFVYFLLISVRNIFYRLHIFREYALGAKVISVGNITWGGTGKTPAVLFILRRLLEKGLKPAILIRGYGNDESELLRRFAGSSPVLIGKDRVRNGREAMARYSADTLLLDDGFQYRRLKRDMDIVCIDSTDPFGNGCMIPCGSMRESLGGLKRTDIFLITKADLVSEGKLQDLEEKLSRINPDALIVKAVYNVECLYKLSGEEKVDVGELKQRDVVLVSAIGNPYAFERTVLKCGLNITKHFIFRDHYWYKEKDLKRIKDYCAEHKIDTIITTEKDAVKLSPFTFHLSPFTYLVLGIKLEIIENEERFLDRLFGIYRS